MALFKQHFFKICNIVGFWTTILIIQLSEEMLNLFFFFFSEILNFLCQFMVCVAYRIH